jgi:hypothetical protein
VTNHALPHDGNRTGFLARCSVLKVRPLQAPEDERSPAQPTTTQHTTLLPRKPSR